MIPIIVVSYNNYKYVRNTINQLGARGLLGQVTVMDNHSSCTDTLNYLFRLAETTAAKVIFRESNEGPWICSWKNADIYHSLPDKFIITDPDLQFNPNLPSNFLEVLADLSDHYQCNKIGFALDISDSQLMFQTSSYANNQSIADWESHFWDNKLDTSGTRFINLDLYRAEIDTTFCLVNKQATGAQSAIRVAGDFTAKHLPWYRDNAIYSIYELLQPTESCISTISTISKVTKSYIDENFFKIYKNDELFLIEKSTENTNQNLDFWKNIYSSWEIETFHVFDKFLDFSKIFIDIGGWIGTTAMYGARKSKHVYSVEADIGSFADMTKNINFNCQKGCTTLINRAIFNVSDIDIKFGKNKFMSTSKLNDSTSQIYGDADDADAHAYLIKTITLQKIIEEYHIDPNEISLIKVDIEGGEENILHDLFNIHKTFQVPLYISFHYDWWQNKDLDRFAFLSADQKATVRRYPFISLLFQ